MPVGSAGTAALPGAGDRELHLTRVFDAPRRLVFEAWTDPKQVALWWGPHGFTNPVCALDVRPGGAIRIDMHGPDGHAYPMSGVFREIARPDRLVFTSAALDDERRLLFEVLNTVTFAERSRKTTVTARARVVRWNPETPPSLEGMREGLNESLDRLAAYMAKGGEDGERMVPKPSGASKRI